MSSASILGLDESRRGRVEHHHLVSKKNFPRVVLEGCNGSWAQERYVPILVESAARGEIELWAIDVKGKPEPNSPRSKKAWKVAQSKGNAHYVNKIIDEPCYERIPMADFVFIVAPGRLHAEIAEFWLDRISSEGKIFVEKPLDESVAAALRLKGKAGGKKGSVLAFDHYVAKAHPFLREARKYLWEVGEMERIEFSILEPSDIPESRVEVLTRGVVFDLFCHVMALAGAAYGYSVVPSKLALEQIEFEVVKAARYAGCPIPGETFAWIRLLIGDVTVESMVGKGVGVEENKLMKIRGAKGRAELDFSRNEAQVLDPEGKMKESVALDARHVESFLEEVLKGNPANAPGVFDLDAALEILKLLDAAKYQIDKTYDKYWIKMFEYTIGSGSDEILKNMT